MSCMKNKRRLDIRCSTIEDVYQTIDCTDFAGKLQACRAGVNASAALPKRQVGVSAVLPAGALEGRDVIRVNCISDTEIRDKGPVGWDVERGGQARGVEDRNPTEANAIGAGGEPERMDGQDGRVFDHFRHRPTAEAVALVGA